jgi:MFS family permease
LKALGVWESVWYAIKNCQNWFCGFYTSFMNLPLMVLGGAWGKMYLTTVKHVTDIQAANITMVLFLGMAVGCPVIGWISDQLALRRLPMIIFAIFSLPVMLGIIYLPNLSYLWLIVLFFLSGVFAAAQTIGYPTIAESNAKAITSTAMGLASVLIMGGPAVFDPLFGWLMDKQWDGTIINGGHVYAAHAYGYAMLTLPLMLFVGLVASLFIRETFAREKSN